MTLENAVFAAARMHDAEVASFLSFERVLIRRSSKHPEVARFVAALKGWMRANLDWSLETGRYSAVIGPREEQTSDGSFAPAPPTTRSSLPSDRLAV